MALYVCEDSADMSADDLVDLATLMPASRHERWQRLKSPADARNMVVAYWLTMYGLRTENPETVGLPWRYSRYGKPLLDGVEFNISHSGVRCVCGVSGHEIGVDVQRIERDMDVFTIAEVVMSVREMSRIARAADSHSAFTRLWSMKESYVKCLGGGLYYHLPSIDFSQLSEAGGNYRGIYLETWRSGDYWFSVCTREPEARPVDVCTVPCEDLVELAKEVAPEAVPVG